MTIATPSKKVLSAFGVKSKPTLLEGGQGNTFKANEIVLKPIVNEDEANWVAELSSKIEPTGFRLEQPIKSISGKWIYKGWSAFTFIEGKTIKGRWVEQLDTSRKFHKAISHVPKPDFLDKATHPWAIADKMVWGKIPLKHTHALDPIIPRLQKLLKPIKTTDQLIHGDLTENILFHDTLPPAIIDFSPYWHPAKYADATIVIEAIVWENAPSTLLQQLDNTSEMNQLVIRAIMWLIKSSEEFDLLYKSNNLDFKVKKYNQFVDLFNN